MAKRVSKKKPTTRKKAVPKTKTTTNKKTEKKPRGGVRIQNQKNKNTNGFTQNPENAGRRKNIINQLEKQINTKFNMQLSKKDKTIMIGSLLEMNTTELKKVIANKKTPSFLVIVAKGLMRDIDNSSMSNLSALSGGSIAPSEGDVPQLDGPKRELVLSYSPDDIDVEIIDSEADLEKDFDNYQIVE